MNTNNQLITDGQVRLPLLVSVVISVPLTSTTGYMSPPLLKCEKVKFVLKMTKINGTASSNNKTHICQNKF